MTGVHLVLTQAASTDATIIVYSAERILSIDWHISGEVIVTGGIDNIRLWCADSGNAIQRITIARQSAQKETIVWAIAILKVCINFTT